MGFALWIENDVAWAQGTHEYRPMGAAVIAVTDVFHPRDFMPRRRSPHPMKRASFAGLFASLGHVNRHLRQRRSQPSRNSRREGPRLLISIT